MASTMATKTERILAAARAFAEQGHVEGDVKIHEFGVPALGLDDTETHFVVIESDLDPLLVKVTIDLEGRARAERLTA